MASAKSKEYQLAIKIAGQVSSSFNSAIGEAEGKLTNLGTVAKQAAAVAAAAWGALQVGQFISDAVGTYGEFEQAMANTSAIAGATGEQYDALRAAALEMGKATTKSASECADALGYMSLAGWSVNDSIASLEPILRLSEATQMDLARCSDLVTDSMSALGLGVQDLPKYLDVAAQANNKSNQTAEMLMEAYIGVGGTLKNLRVPIQESGAALGVLANRGIKGSEAGNALNAVLVNLTTGTGQAGKMMEQLGISAFDSAGNFIGLQETIQRVYEATKDMTEAERNAALAAIGGKQHTDALNALMSGLTTTTAEGVTEWNALTQALYNSDGALGTMADTVTNTWQGATERLKFAMDDLKINLVSTFAPYATAAINQVAEYIPHITTAVTAAAQSFTEKALPHIIAFKDRAVELFGMASSGIGQVVSEHSATFDKLGELASRIGAFFADLKVNGEPVLDFIAGTALPAIVDGALNLVDRLADLGIFLTEHKTLVLAIIAAYAGFKGLTALSNLGGKITAATKTLEAFQQVTKGTSLVTSVLNGKLPATSAAFGVLTGKIKLTELATEAVKGKLSAFTGGFKAIGSLGKTAFSGLKSGVLAFGGVLKSIGASIMSFMATNPVGWVILAIAAVIGIVVLLYNKCEWFREKVDAIIAAVKVYLQAFWEKAKVVFQNIWETVKEVWAKIAPYLQAAWNTIVSAVSAVISFFQTNVLPGIRAVLTSIGKAFSAAWELIKTIWDFVKPYFLAIWEAIKAIFGVAVKVLGGFFKAAWERIKLVWAVVSPWFSTIWEYIKAVFSVVGAVLGGFFKTAWETIKGIWNTAVAFFQAVFDTIAGIFSAVKAVLHGDFAGAWEAIKGVFSSWGNYFQTLWDSIKNIFGAVGEWLGGVFSAAWSGIGNITSTALESLKGSINAIGTFLQEKVPFLGAIFTGWASSITAAIDNIKAVFGGIIEFIQNVFSGNWSAAWQNIVDIFSNIFGAIANLVKAPINGVISAINFILEKINSISVTIPDWVPGVGGKQLGFNLPTIPQLAEGGVVNQPTLLEAGEAGTEAIIPLSELWGQMHGLMEDAMRSSNVIPITDLLAELRGNRDNPPPQDGGNGQPPIVIHYQPQYHFEGEAPSREDLEAAERMSQEEFNRMAKQWLKDIDRTKLA